MREVAAEREKPVLLFSGGKDSIVLVRLAEKAFRPGKFPFPLMHIDTGHNFSEVIEFRDNLVERLGERLVVASVQESIDSGRVVEETGPRASRNRLQTTTLLDALAEHGFDAAFGGARRDEERARAKERILSLPRRLRRLGPQGPAARAVEHLQHARAPRRERPRVPAEQLDRARRLAVHPGRGDRGALDLPGPRARGLPSRRDALRRLRVHRARRARLRSLHRIGALPHRRRHLVHRRRGLHCRRRWTEVVAEIAATDVTERGETRADDRVSESAMEDRKVAGYF